MFLISIYFNSIYKEIHIKHSFKDFDQFSTTMALAELQATKALDFDMFVGYFQSADDYLSEMSKNYTNAGNICLFK